MKKNNRMLVLLIIIASHNLSCHNTAIFHRYLWANYNQFKGDVVSAQKWYKHLFSSPCSLYTYKGYVNLLFNTKQNSRIIELIPLIDKQFENDPEIQLIFAISLEKNNQIQESDERLVKISSQFKTHPEITLRTTQAYMRRKEPENALITIETFLNNSPRKPHNFVFYFLKSQINLQLSQYEQALTSITTCLDMHPRFDKGWLLFATLQEQKGKLKKAIQGYGTFLELTEQNNMIKGHLASLMLQYNKNKQSKKSMLFQKSYFEQALSLYEKHNYASALTHIDIFLKKEPAHKDAQLLKIKLLTHLNAYDLLETSISQWLAQDSHNSSFWPQNLYLLSYIPGISPEKIITTLNKLSADHSENIFLLLYAGDLCIRNKKITQASALLNKALQKSTDTKLNATIYYQLALLEYEKKQYPNMLTLLDNAYKQDPTLTHVNNALAYYWATKGKNLVKAQKFLNESYTQEKPNAYVLDTKAVIFYKQHNYQAAKEILEQLDQHNNPTILLHLAKVHYKLDNKKAALSYINKAALCTINNYHEKTFNKMRLLLTAND